MSDDQSTEPTEAVLVNSEEVETAIPVAGDEAREFANRVAAQLNAENGVTDAATGASSEPDSDVTGAVADLLCALHAQNTEEAGTLLVEIGTAIAANRWPDIPAAIEIMLPSVEA